MVQHNSFVLMLVVFLSCGWVETAAAAASKANQPQHVLFVSLPWRGHVNPLRAIAQQLLAKGYAVSFALPSECRHWVEGDGAEFIPLGQTIGIRREPDNYPSAANGMGYRASADGPRGILSTLARYHAKMFSPLYHHLAKHKPALMVIDRFTLAGFDVARALNITYIVNNPHFLLAMDGPPCHIPAPYAYLPSYPETLTDRTTNLYYWMRYRLDVARFFGHLSQGRHVSLEQRQALGEEERAALGANLDEFHGSSIVLTNTAFGLEYPRELEPRFKMIGPVMHTPDPLGSRLQEWLDMALRARHPVIYVNLGAESALEVHEAQALLEGLVKKKHKILWSMPKSRRHLLPKSLPASVRWNSFVPQVSVLAHEAVKIFVTHCGLTGVQEALVHHKPMLGLPSYVDQWEVANRAAGVGTALVLDKRTLTPAIVAAAVHALLVNESFTQRAVEVATVLRGSGGVVEATKAIELTFRIGSSYLLTHYQKQAFDGELSLHQSYLLDVYAIYFTVLGAVALLVCQCWVGLVSLWEYAGDPGLVGPDRPL